jgi:hypothetical protein
MWRTVLVTLVITSYKEKLGVIFKLTSRNMCKQAYLSQRQYKLPNTIDVMPIEEESREGTANGKKK